MRERRALFDQKIRKTDAVSDVRDAVDRWRAPIGGDDIAKEKCGNVQAVVQVILLECVASR